MKIEKDYIYNLIQENFNKNLETIQNKTLALMRKIYFEIILTYNTKQANDEKSRITNANNMADLVNRFCKKEEEFSIFNKKKELQKHARKVGINIL